MESGILSGMMVDLCDSFRKVSGRDVPSHSVASALTDAVKLDEDLLGRVATSLSSLPVPTTVHDADRLIEAADQMVALSREHNDTLPLAAAAKLFAVVSAGEIKEARVRTREKIAEVFEWVFEAIEGSSRPACERDFDLLGHLICAASMCHSEVRTPSRSKREPQGIDTPLSRSSLTLTVDRTSSHREVHGSIHVMCSRQESGRCFGACPVGVWSTARDWMERQDVRSVRVSSVIYLGASGRLISHAPALYLQGLGNIALNTLESLWNENLLLRRASERSSKLVLALASKIAASPGEKGEKNLSSSLLALIFLRLEHHPPRASSLPGFRKRGG